MVQLLCIQEQFLLYSGVLILLISFMKMILTSL